MFYPGGLVVCVLERACPHCGTPSPTCKGTVYTVTEVFPRGLDTGLTLDEVPTPQGHSGFNAKNFRPVKSIEVFKRIAASPRERIRIGEDA